MVYGICYYPLSKAEDVKSLGLAGEAVIFSICHVVQCTCLSSSLLLAGTLRAMPLERRVEILVIQGHYFAPEL